MSRLKHITFTGVDSKTDIKALIEIQKQYPIVEFGILTSYHWFENGNRYLDPRLFRFFTKANLNLALHICGSAAHDAACEDWSEIHYLSWGEYRWFRRIQLNIAGRRDNPEYAQPSPWDNEIIIQQKDINNLDFFYETQESWPKWCKEKLSVLLDASGGQGKDTELKILDADWKVGYAGGFNQGNVGDKLSFLEENIHEGEYWIDMESGVRTDDWFDVDKVVKVLEICNQIVPIKI